MFCNNQELVQSKNINCQIEIQKTTVFRWFGEHVPFTIFCQEGDNCKPQVFARQDQAMLKLSLNHLRRNRKRFNGFFNVVGLIFHESGAVKNDNVHKNLHIHHSKKLLLVFKKIIYLICSLQLFPLFSLSSLLVLYKN